MLGFDDRIPASVLSCQNLNVGGPPARFSSSSQLFTGTFFGIHADAKSSDKKTEDSRSMEFYGGVAFARTKRL